MKLTPQSQLALRLTSEHYLKFWQSYFSALSTMAKKESDLWEASSLDEKKRIMDEQPDGQKAGRLAKDFMGLFLEEMQNLIIDGKPYIETEARKKFMNWVKPNRNFLVSGRAAALADKINIGDTFDLNFLSRIEDKRVTFMLGENQTIRYQKTDNEILASIISQSVSGNLQFFFFRLVLDKNEVYLLTPLGEERLIGSPTMLNQDTMGLPEYQVKSYLWNFLRLLLFTELGKVFTVWMKPGESKVLPGAIFKTKNESSVDVGIVDSNWNKQLVITGKFPVSGHIRLQPCGVGRLDRELIWIKEFVKSGYTRRAGVEIEREKNQNQ